GKCRLKSGLAAIAAVHEGLYALTTNQNLIIAGISEGQRPVIGKLLADYGLVGTTTALRRRSMACVAMPTCALAMAESERYLPSLIDRLDEVIREAGLEDRPVT